MLQNRQMVILKSSLRENPAHVEMRFLYAAGANTTYGLQRSNADKRKVIKNYYVIINGTGGATVKLLGVAKLVMRWSETSEMSCLTTAVRYKINKSLT